MTNDNQTMMLMKADLGSDMNIKTDANYSVGNITNLSAWGYWQDYYYPSVIRESYPVYIRERAEDKGKQAFEIIKALQDKKLIKLDKVADFIETMDTLIKIL